MTATIVKKVAAHPLTERPGARQLKSAARWVRERYALSTWDDRVLPELLLVGAQRCGTTALTESLFRMPMVERPRRGKGSHYFSYNYWRGWEWFQSQFPRHEAAARVQERTGHRLVCFDACPYYLFHPFAIERLAKDLPDAKVLIMLRDPVRRAQSHYHHSVAHGHESLSFPEALAAETQRMAGEVDKMAADERYWSCAHEHLSYLQKGHYAEQLEHLFEWIPREQTMILQAEAFYRAPEATLASVTDWVGLPHATLDDSVERNGHEYRPMDPEIEAHLIEHYQPHNERLYELLGTRYDWLA